MKQLVSKLQKCISNPQMVQEFPSRFAIGIKSGNDDKGFYFMIKDKKYRCLNEEINSGVKLPHGSVFDSSTDIVLCSDTFLVKNNDPMEKYVVITVIEELIRDYEYIDVSGISSNDNEMYPTCLKITCPISELLYVSGLEIMEFLNMEITASYKDIDKVPPRDVLKQFLYKELQSMKIQTKKLKNGFCFTLYGKEYTCTTEEIAYLKLTKDLSFSPETDILISTDEFMPDAQEQSDRYAVIKVVSNKNITQQTAKRNVPQFLGQIST